MHHRTPGFRKSPAVLAACVLAALAAGGCSDDSGETDDADSNAGADPASLSADEAATEAERLATVANENLRIEDELSVIEVRIAKKCMEDADFTVHNPAEFETTNFSDYGATGYLGNAPLQAVPTAEEAQQRGFGVWVQFIHHPGNEHLVEELLTPEIREAFDLPTEDYTEPDSSEWDAQGSDYQSRWIEAYTGAPAIEGSVKGPEADWEAELGGCKLEMIETIYGEPYFIEGDVEDGEDTGYMATHQPSPRPSQSGAENFLEGEGGASEWQGHLDGQDDDFESCLVNNGYEGWELGEGFYPPLWEYFGAMYDPAYFDEFGGEEGLAVPEQPEDVPDSFTEVMDLEISMAADFAVCAEESGLRAAIEYGWAVQFIDAYQLIETDILGWQETMQGHLDSAQEYLEQ